MSGSRDVSASGFESNIAWASQEGFNAATLAEISSDVYGPNAARSTAKSFDTSIAHLSDFQIIGADNQSTLAVLASKPLSAKLEAAVDKFEQAANGGLTGIGTDEAGMWDAIAPLNASELALVNERFAQKYGKDYAAYGQKWDMRNELLDELGQEDLSRFARLIKDKNINEVPQEFRVSGDALLKPNSGLTAGEISRISLADGRDYDVYIPRNADSRAPVIVAMPGAGLGDMKGVMANESGLTIDAEKTGSIVIFANPKSRVLDGSLGMASASWNTPGRTNLPGQIDNSYDDRVYMDNVLNDLAARSKMADKVGMIGFSDGARFAEVYAADRPERVAGVVSMSGTWMEGDAAPSKAIPMMIVHGDKDEMLPYKGGLGDTSEETPIATNLDKSRPAMQAKVWSEAGGGTGDVVQVAYEKGVEQRIYSGSQPVVEYIVQGADHGIHDYKNNGNRWIQWALGEPQLQHDFVSKGAGFLKQHIVRDLTGK
jgi:poly(3-hydroxybutyrate) depolymerase